VTTGYSLRNTPTLLERMNAMTSVNLNRPKRRSFDDWIADLQKLSGVKDVSQVDLSDADIQESFADDYARNEAAEGRWREEHPNDPTET